MANAPTDEGMKSLGLMNMDSKSLPSLPAVAIMLEGNSLVIFTRDARGRVLAVSQGVALGFTAPANAAGEQIRCIGKTGTSTSVPLLSLAALPYFGHVQRRSVPSMQCGKPPRCSPAPCVRQPAPRVTRVPRDRDRAVAKEIPRARPVTARGVRQPLATTRTRHS